MVECDTHRAAITFLGGVSCLESFLENRGFRAMGKNYWCIIGSSIEPVPEAVRERSETALQLARSMGDTTQAEKAEHIRHFCPGEERANTMCAGWLALFWLFVFFNFLLFPLFLLYEVHIENTTSLYLRKKRPDLTA